MSITITAQDGTGDATTPTRITRYDAASDSGNVVHEMIAPGEIAVTIVGDLPPAGSVSFLYTTDAAADAARALLGRRTSFTLVDTDRASLGMTFVRDGRLSPVIHDELENLWIIEVGFQEIVP